MAEEKLEYQNRGQNDFWGTIYTATGTIVKPYILNIFGLLSYDNPFSFSQMTKADITNAENFVKNEMHEFVEANVNKKEYYGIYLKNHAKFKFVDGDRKCY